MKPHPSRVLTIRTLHNQKPRHTCSPFYKPIKFSNPELSLRCPSVTHCSRSYCSPIVHRSTAISIVGVQGSHSGTNYILSHPIKTNFKLTNVILIQSIQSIKITIGVNIRGTYYRDKIYKIIELSSVIAMSGVVRRCVVISSHVTRVLVELKIARTLYL